MSSGLLERLGRIGDGRQERGRLYPVSAVLALAAGRWRRGYVVRWDLELGLGRAAVVVPGVVSAGWSCGTDAGFGQQGCYLAVVLGVVGQFGGGQAGQPHQSIIRLCSGAASSGSQCAARF